MATVLQSFFPIGQYGRKVGFSSRYSSLVGKKEKDPEKKEVGFGSIWDRTILFSLAVSSQFSDPRGTLVKKEEKKKKEMSEKRNIRDHKRRLLAAKYELRRKLYKAFCKDSDLPSDMRDKLRYKLSKLPRNSSFARVRNRCISTGRPRSVYEFFRISRIVFRGLASRGPLMGIKKSSW
ncbi:hypothetical protein VNO77_49347 [Canavalia gladiata]